MPVAVSKNQYFDVMVTALPGTQTTLLEGGELWGANLDEYEKTWHDDNGHSHVQASLLGPSLSVPIIDGQMTLGTWQQIILVDFDTRPRQRTVICQIIGE